MAVAPVLALESPWSHDFDDVRLEWRRLFSEFLGTFLLVLVGAGGAVVDAASGGQIGRAAGVAAPGLLVLAVILFMGTVSGAPLNPAVTLAFTIRGDFPWRRVPGYIVVQLAAAVSACLVLRAVFGDIGGLGATLPGAGFPKPGAGARRRRAPRPLLQPGGGGRGGTADPRPGEHHPGHGVVRAERRTAVGDRGRRVHRPGRVVVQPGQRCVDEPGAFLRTGAGGRGLEFLLGLPGGAPPGRRGRGRCGRVA